MTIQKIKYHRVYEDVIEQIERLIAEGELSPGDALPTERELAQAFGISRGTLREAFRILEREGLIETRPGGGRSVARRLGEAEDRKALLDRIERATILELLEARALFEAGIVELAAERASEEDLEEIGRALARWGTIERAGEEQGTPDQAFHMSIARASRNVVLVNLIELHMDLLRRTMCKTAAIPGRHADVYREHAAIYEAIRSRDPARAKEALLAHLAQVKRHVMRQEEPIVNG
ncbi:FadR/GntR family transcriptional regulator [Cohnella sp. REN36]|uniref:FadR/GntR family transcriptional regulator n=1 Tax=Cohnella sp. REN36 TaxID=2887347 RepID=UPI001D14CF25|nr:FadR/GntR family transcriptional regulator [Cohnella sp. REN36]MCC3373258.1 FadR family transcriptional regulator [Cohnella sp. REN36]